MNGNRKQFTLKEGTKTILTASYTYDTRGNRVSMAVTGTEAYTTAYAYDGKDRLTKETKTDTAGIAVTNYNYDPNGNLIGKGYETYAASRGSPVAARL